MLILFVEIENAGSGSDSNIGLVSGSLKWASHDAYGYKGGIIDRNTVSQVTHAMNISRGGGFGGFQGTVSVTAYSKELVSAVISKDVNLIGKSLIIKVGLSNDGSEDYFDSQRFICPISAFRISNEGMITIDCNTSKAFDRKKIGGITVTKEMALNDASNPAIGKPVITPIGGDITDYPAVYVSTENIAIALSVISSLEYDVSAPKLGIFNTLFGSYSTESGELKGASLFTVFSKYQEDAIHNVKIAITFNGSIAMGAYLSAPGSVTLLRRLFVGMRIKCVRGSGIGSIYDLLSVEYAKHNGTSAIWIEISTKEIDDISIIGDSEIPNLYTGFDTGFYAGLEAFPFTHYSHTFKSKWSESLGIENNASYFSIIGNSNIFIVHGSIDLSNGCKLLGKSEDSGINLETVIPYDSIKVLYSGTNWKMVQISSDDVVLGDSSSFWFKSLLPVRSQIHTTYPATGLSGTDVNSMGVLEYGTNVNEIISDKKSDGYEIKSDGTGEYLKSGTIETVGAVTPLWSNLMFVPIEDFINGIDVSNIKSSVSVIPSFYYRFTTIRDTLTGGDWNVICTVSGWIIGEGNTILEQYCNEARYEKTFTFQTRSTPSPLVKNSFKLFLDPANGKIVITENTNGASEDVTDDYESFNSIAASLKINDALKAHNSKQIRGVLIQTRMRINSDIEINGVISDTDISKRIYKSYIGYSSVVKKENIFIQAKRDNGTDVVNTPISIAKKIIDENGIIVDSTSFNSVISKHQSFYDPISESKSQYHVEKSEKFSDVIDNLCKQSMTAIFQEGDGKLYAKWFADDDADTPTVYTFTDIISGSLEIDKPSSGYLSTDFDFTIKESHIKNESNVFINTDESILSFPDSGFSELYGSEIVSGSDGFLFENFPLESVTVLHIRKDQNIFDLLLKFPIGTFWRIGGHYYSDPGTTLYSFGRISAVSTTLKYGSIGVMIGFSNITNQYGDLFIIDRIQLVSPNEKWRDYVSGSFVSDYTTARNIWEHAQNARIAVGVESKMSSEYTTLRQPVWGDDAQAIMQWILYTVIHNTREKTVITFSTKMTPETILLKKLDYVLFKFGPYNSINGIAQAGVKGWICEIVENYERMEFTFSILTSVSDTDAFIIDERIADGSILIDENPASNDFYDEGRLA